MKHLIVVWNDKTKLVPLCDVPLTFNDAKMAILKKFGQDENGEIKTLHFYHFSGKIIIEDDCDLELFLEFFLQDYNNLIVNEGMVIPPVNPEIHEHLNIPDIISDITGLLRSLVRYVNDLATHFNDLHKADFSGRVNPVSAAEQPSKLPSVEDNVPKMPEEYGDRFIPPSDPLPSPNRPNFDTQQPVHPNLPNPPMDYPKPPVNVFEAETFRPSPNYPPVSSMDRSFVPQPSLSSADGSFVQPPFPQIDKLYRPQFPLPSMTERQFSSQPVPPVERPFIQPSFPQMERPLPLQPTYHSVGDSLPRPGGSRLPSSFQEPQKFPPPSSSDVTNQMRRDERIENNPSIASSEFANRFPHMSPFLPTSKYGESLPQPPFRSDMPYSNMPPRNMNFMPMNPMADMPRRYIPQQYASQQSLNSENRPNMPPFIPDMNRTSDNVPPMGSGMPLPPRLPQPPYIQSSQQVRPTYPYGYSSS